MQTTKLLTFLDELEAVGAEVASKLAPWLAPLLSAVVVGRAVTAAPFSWPTWLAWLTGAAIELSGIATLNTALLLWSYRAEQPTDKKPSAIPLVLAVGCALGYLITALALTVVLKILPGFEVLAYGLFVVLALTSAVNLTLRRDHVRRTTVQPKRPQVSRQKSASEAPKSSFVPGDLAALEAANAARFASVEQRREQVARMLSEGMSQPAIAQALGVSVSSIRRDKAALSNGRVEVHHG
jgi:DNA-binding NarL/FixJ family response regulator